MRASSFFCLAWIDAILPSSAFCSSAVRARSAAVSGASLNQLLSRPDGVEAVRPLERAARGRAQWRQCASATARPAGCQELRRKIQGRARSGRRTGPARAEICENAHTSRANDRRSEPIRSRLVLHRYERSPQVRCATRPRVELARGIHLHHFFLRAGLEESEQFCLV